MAEPYDTLVTFGTILKLDGLGIPPFSAHELSQSIEEDDSQGEFERDINNNLVDLSPPWDRKKLKISVTCQDVNPPAFNGSPRGKAVTLESVAEFAFLTSEGTGGYLQTAGVTRENNQWRIQGQPLSPAKKYIVAITDFLLTGGETNLGFLTRTNPHVHDVKEFRDIRQAVIEELRAR